MGPGHVWRAAAFMALMRALRAYSRRGRGAVRWRGAQEGTRAHSCVPPASAGLAALLRAMHAQRRAALEAEMARLDALLPGLAAGSPGGAGGEASDDEL
jgi:hypothetical protein